MIAGSFIVTFYLRSLQHLTCHRSGCVHDRNLSENGTKILQPVIELLVGIPSVVYGFIGLSVIVPFIPFFGGTGFGILAGTICVVRNAILPTVTTMTVDALKAVPKTLS